MTTTQQGYICVFGASAPNIPRIYAQRVTALCKRLGDAGRGLVFGGFADSLMQAAADGFAAAGEEIVGVVPATLMERRTVHPACTRVIETADLESRKAEMMKLATAYLTVPGGIGTLDELFSVLAMTVVGESAKKVVLYDVDGFYGGLVTWLERLEVEGFMHCRLDELMLVSGDDNEVVRYLSADTDLLRI